MEYPSDGKCRNCGATLPQMLHGICVCGFCETEYTKPVTAPGTATSSFDKGTAVSFIEKADIAYEKKRIGEAISCLEEALTYDPTNYLIWTKMGRAYRQANNLDQARECYHKALKLKPDAIEVIGNLGVLEIYCNNYQLAYQYCKKAYETGGTTPADNAMCAANFALAAAKMGNKKEALQLLEIAKKRGYGNYAILKRTIKQS